MPLITAQAISITLVIVVHMNFTTAMITWKAPVITLPITCSAAMIYGPRAAHRKRM
ncbi:hypothetical protein D3C87_2154010 [compost metagenome]